MRIHCNLHHSVGRSQEIPMLVAAGFEIVPALGMRENLRFDPDYANETHVLYPDWTVNCTLPVSVAAQLRRIDLQNQIGNVGAPQADLINEHIDAIYVMGLPQVVGNIAKWFRGAIICRIAGTIAGTVPFLWRNDGFARHSFHGQDDLLTDCGDSAPRA